MISGVKICCLDRRWSRTQRKRPSPQHHGKATVAFNGLPRPHSHQMNELLFLLLFSNLSRLYVVWSCWKYGSKLHITQTTNEMCGIVDSSVCHNTLILGREGHGEDADEEKKREPIPPAHTNGKGCWLSPRCYGSSLHLWNYSPPIAHH